MIAKENRFHGHHSLDFTYRHGKAVRSEGATLRYIKAKGDQYRLAVVVSKKVHKSAVVRNRIRRRIYEIFRVQDQENNLPLLDMIFTVHDDRFATASGSDLSDQITKIIEKIK